MPESFDPKRPHHLRGDAMLRRPKLAVHVATIAALWSGTEFLQGCILAHLVKGDPGAVAALFTTLRSTRGQREALEAVADSADLSVDLRDELGSIVEDIKGRSRERNQIIHAIWGLSPDYPDAIVHCTIESWLKLHANAHGIQNETTETAAELFALIDRKVSPSLLEMRLFREHDFVQVVKRIETLNKRIHAYMRKVKPDFYWQEDLSEALREPDA